MYSLILQHFQIGGVENIHISKDILNSVRMSRQKYHLYLDNQKIDIKKAELSKKRKFIEDSIKVIKGNLKS